MPVEGALTEELLDLQVPRDIKLSPDGGTVIYATTLCYGHRTGEHTLSMIWRADTGKQDSARPLTSGQFNDRNPQWAPNGEYIAFLSDRAKPSKSTAVYLLPLSGGEAFPITAAEHCQNISKLEFSLDGKFIVYLSPDEESAERKRKHEEGDDAQVWGENWAFNRLRSVHVSTKKLDVLLSRAAHVTDFAWSDDGKKIATTTTETPDIESPLLRGTLLSVVDLVKKSEERICHFPTEAKGLVWTGQSLYFLGGSLPELPISSRVVYAVDLSIEGQTFKKQACGDTDCAVRIAKAGGNVVIQIQDGIEDQIKILNGRVLFRKKQEAKHWDAAFVHDSDEIIIASTLSSINHPTEVFTDSSHGLVQLSNHGSAFKSRTFGFLTFLSAPTIDGKEYLDGLFITPAENAKSDGTPQRPLATAVIVHGGPYFRDTDRFDTAFYYWTNALLAAGYAVLQVNYRGSSGRGMHFAEYARGGMGLYDEPDIVAMTQHAVEKGFADREKLLVGGYSQGGFISYLCAVRNGEHDFGWKFRGVIPGAGVVDWGTMALSSDLGIEEAALGNGGPWYMYANDLSNRQGSPLYEMRKAAEKGDVIPPMLILHGEKDVRAPIEQARGFRRGLDHWRLPYEFVIYPREDHVFRERHHIRDMMERIVMFADKQLC